LNLPFKAAADPGAGKGVTCTMREQKSEATAGIHYKQKRNEKDVPYPTHHHTYFHVRTGIPVSEKESNLAR
jgi:hypothetical protein